MANHPDMIPWDSNGNSGIATLGYLMSTKRYVPIYELTTYGIWGEDLDHKGKIISPYYTGNELMEYSAVNSSDWSVLTFTIKVSKLSRE